MTTKSYVTMRRYALEPNGPIRLEIALDPVQDTCAIRLDNHPIAHFTYKHVLQGIRVPLPDQTTLDVQAVFRRFAPQLIITRDGVPVPGSEKGTVTIGKRQSLGWGAIALVGLFVVVVVGSVGAVVFRGYENTQESAAAQATRQTLLGVYHTNMATYTEPGELTLAVLDNPKINNGSLLMIDKTTNEVDRFYIEHPSALPGNPENIAFVLWLACEDRQVGTYEDGMRAFQTTCALTLIDLAAKTIIHQRTLTGPQPPASKRGAGDVSGGRPDDAIRDYFNALM